MPIERRADDGSWLSNLRPEYPAALADRTGLAWCAAGGAQSASEFDSRDLLALLYAQLQASAYRAAFEEELRLDFPRVFVPRDAHAFRTLVTHGQALIELHADPGVAAPDCPVEVTRRGPDGTRVMRGYPRYEESSQLIHLGPDTRIGPFEASAWELRVGGYPVLAKWLAGRAASRGREGYALTAEQWRRFASVAAAVEQTVLRKRQLDESIRELGGFEAAFGLDG